MESIKNLSIITITFNNRLELIKTYQSLEQFRNYGGTHIIVHGGSSVSDIVIKGDLVEEPDKGIYDALNKGICRVSTPYFMLVHSGDLLVEDIEILETLLDSMKDENIDLMLNDCSIEYGYSKRYMKSRRWKPWMFRFGAQPPHPPIIYKTQSVSRYNYDLNHPVIADFKYLEDLFKAKLRYGKGNRLLVHMSAGGATSSGFKSFFHVNKQFRKLKGRKKAMLFTFSRPLIKLYQMI